MRNVIFTLLALMLTCSIGLAQKIKLFDSYLKFDNMESRYVVVLADNSIWWYAPENPWKKSSMEGLPAGADIKILSAYSKEDGTSRYVVVLSDNSIWWYAPDNPWKKSSTEGLPGGYSIKDLKAYTKTDGSRYVALLSDNSVWWYAPDGPWKKTTMEGLVK